MGELVITGAMILFLIGAAALFYRLSKSGVPSEDGSRIRDRSLAEGQALQNRIDGINSQ